MKATILRGKHIVFLVLPSKYSFILKREIGQKLLFHNCGFTSWLVIYGITDSFKPWDVYVLLISII